MIDDNVESYFHTYDAGNKKEFVPDEVIVDMGNYYSCVRDHLHTTSGYV